MIFISLKGCYTENPNEVVQKTSSYERFDVNAFNKKPEFYIETLKEKVVEIEGVVEEVNSLNNRSTIILTDKNDASFSAICDMQKIQNAKIEHIKSGDIITIKGMLKGSLKDIILLNCIIVNN